MNKELGIKGIIVIQVRLGFGLKQVTTSNIDNILVDETVVTPAEIIDHLERFELNAREL